MFEIYIAGLNYWLATPLGGSDTLNWYKCCENYSCQKSCSKVGSKNRTAALCGTCLLFNILKETRENRDL